MIKDSYSSLSLVDFAVLWINNKTRESDLYYIRMRDTVTLNTLSR